MKKIIAMLLLVGAMALALPSAVQAQPCVPTFNGAPFTPSTELVLGQSACIKVCQFSFVNFLLLGADRDEAGIPVLLTATGCDPMGTNCDASCSPVTPPSVFVLGGGVFFPNPGDWAGYNECMEIAYRWNHDGYWEIEIFSLCEGCFCLTFDDQLDVELSSFTAVAGDGSVNVAWTTASESQMDQFNVVRDGVMVEQVNATNSATGHTYSWVDTDVRNGETYHYTLQGVDLSGQTSTYATASATPGSAGAVEDFGLAQNFPNPFNPETSISFSLPVASNVSLRVFNLVGQEVATLVSGQTAAGTHTVNFDGSNLTSGMYIYRLEAGEFSATRKMVLMK